MRRILYLVLTVAVLLTCIPSAVAFAADASATPLSVELISAKAFVNGTEVTSDKTNLGQYFDGWSPIFDSSNVTARVTPFLNADTTIEVVGKFSEPTVVSEVVFRTLGGGARLNGVVVMFSIDGTNWTKGITLQNENAPSKKDVKISVPSDSTAYQYVKIFKSGAIQNETLNSVKGNYLDVYHIRFYSASTVAQSQIIEATYERTLTTATSSNLVKFFDFENTDLCSVSGAVNPDSLVVGQFAHPTVISDVYIRYYGASANWTKVLASTDGVTWVQIAQMTGIWANASNSATKTIAHLPVSDTTAYNYIKIERNHNYGSGWKSYSIGFLGVQDTEETTDPLDPPTDSTDPPTEPVDPPAVDDSNAPVHMRGYQFATAEDGRYAIRLIATTDSIRTTSVGMRLQCTSDDGRTWSFDVSAKELHKNISEFLNDEERLIHAEDLDGARIFTAVVAGIPVDVGTFTVLVTPYADVKGESVEGTARTVVFSPVQE